MWTGEQAPPPLPPPRRRRRFPAEILLIESREGCDPLELSRERGGDRFPSIPSFRCYADAISCGNPFDWKFERVATPLELSQRQRGQVPLRTTLSQIPLKSCGFPGAESARKRFFLRGASSPPKKSARSRRACHRDRLEVERVHTLSRSPGAILLELLFPAKQGTVLMRISIPGETSMGHSAPLYPSRSPGIIEGLSFQ